MRVWLVRRRFANPEFDRPPDIASAIREQNVQVAAGVVGAEPLQPGTASYQLTITALGRLNDPRV